MTDTWVWATMTVGERHESWRLTRTVAEGGGPWFVLEGGKPTQVHLVHVLDDDGSVAYYDRLAANLGFDPADVVRINLGPGNRTATVHLMSGEVREVEVDEARLCTPGRVVTHPTMAGSGSRERMLRLFQQLREQEEKAEQ